MQGFPIEYGEGVAYHDLTAANTIGGYRATAFLATYPGETYAIVTTADTLATAGTPVTATFGFQAAYDGEAHAICGGIAASRPPSSARLSGLAAPRPETVGHLDGFNRPRFTEAGHRRPQQHITESLGPKLRSNT